AERKNHGPKTWGSCVRRQPSARLFETLAAGENRRNPMSTRFSGKTVLVAGGTGGLGQAVALAFLAEGGTGGVTYRREEEFDALKSAAGANSARLEGHRVDVADEAAVSSLIGTVLARHGRLDALVNSVGGYAGGTPLWETEPRVFDQMLALNL